MPTARLCALLIISVLGFASYAATRAEELKARADDRNLGFGFKSEYAKVNGVKLHYVEGGEGRKSLLLIPGWPQTWYLWRKVMLELAKDHRVIAVDKRGMGDSERPESGYDTETVANDLSDLMRRLGIDHYSVIGHDVGMRIAYPLAAEHSEAIDKLVVTEALIPGTTPWPPMLLPPDANAGLTQFMFNQLRDCPSFS